MVGELSLVFKYPVTFSRRLSSNEVNAKTHFLKQAMKNKNYTMFGLPLAALLIGLIPPPAWSAPAGKLVAWGNHQYGQTNVPPGNDFVAIDASQGFHSLALRSDGSLAGWGWNYGEEASGTGGIFYGQATPPAGTNFVAISAGFQYSLAIQVVIEPLSLNIARVGTNVVLSWSANDIGYRLEAKTGLSSSLNWSTVLGMPTIVANQYTITNSVANGYQFYRLKK
jgi:hypothetical protein